MHKPGHELTSKPTHISATAALLAPPCTLRMLKRPTSVGEGVILGPNLGAACERHARAAPPARSRKSVLSQVVPAAACRRHQQLYRRTAQPATRASPPCNLSPKHTPAPPLSPAPPHARPASGRAASDGLAPGREPAGRAPRADAAAPFSRADRRTAPRRRERVVARACEGVVIATAAPSPAHDCAWRPAGRSASGTCKGAHSLFLSPSLWARTVPPALSRRLGRERPAHFLRGLEPRLVTCIKALCPTGSAVAPKAQALKNFPPRPGALLDIMTEECFGTPHEARPRASRGRPSPQSAASRGSDWLVGCVALRGACLGGG